MKKMLTFSHGHTITARSTLRAVTTLAALLIGLCLSLTATAQSEAPRWYQVEIAIFTQPANSQLEANAEQFRKDISLSYGKKTRYLRSLEEVLSDMAAQQAQDQLLTNAVTEAAKPNTMPGTAPASEPSPETIAELLARTPFIKLPVAERGLNDTIGALERRNRQRILFHEAWRQPLTSPEKAVNIVVSGGRHFGDEQELGGTIALGASRYLHLNTNLWIAEFTQNYGQGDLGWPSIPLAPAKHPKAISDERINLNAGLNNPSANDLWSQYDIIDTTYQSMLDKPYVVTQLASLQQDRRMRSGEVHYIDHPKIGIMVFVTPYELPEPSTAEGSSANLNPTQNPR